MRQCHPQFGYAMTEKEYASEWKKNSAYFEEGGHYQWLDDKLGNAKRVLEVGCGAGWSTLTMAKSGRQVLAFEVNIELAQMTRALMAKSGISVQVVNESGADSFNTLLEESQVVIVHADIFDAKHDHDVAAHANIEAIACWMIGAHPGQIGRVINKDFMQFCGSESAECRQRLHTRCFEMGLKVLPARGVVHIADRVAVGSWDQREQLREQTCSVYRTIAPGGYIVEAAATDFRTLGQFMTSGLQYVATKVSGTPSNRVSAAMASVLAVKI